MHKSLPAIQYESLAFQNIIPSAVSHTRSILAHSESNEDTIREDITVTHLNDIHCHFFSEHFFSVLSRSRADLDTGSTVVDALGWDHPGSPIALAQRWINEMDVHKISRVALIASVPGDEDSVATAVAAHPDRFVGQFMLDPTQDDAVERTERALTDLGLCGICLFPAMHHYSLDDDCVSRIASVASAKKHATLFVHCGVLSVGIRKKLGLPNNFDVRLGDPLAIVPLALRFPDLPIIIPHFGAGFFREALIAADLCSNIYLDTSSSNNWIKYHTNVTLTDVFQQVLDILGPDRLLFGSDSSFFPRGWQKPIFESQQAVLQEIDADLYATQRIFYENFERIFAL